MNTVFHARVPVSNPVSSSWKIGLGCSWRLCANRSRPNVVALSLHIIRHQTESSAFIIINAAYPDIQSQPVQSMYVARQLPRHARDLRLHMPKGEQSRAIKLPVTYIPPKENEISLKLGIFMEEQPTSPTAIRDSCFSHPISHGFENQPSVPAKFRQSFIHRRPQLSKGGIRTPSQKASPILWVDEQSRLSLQTKPSQTSLLRDVSPEKENTYMKHAREKLNSLSGDMNEVYPQHGYELKSFLLGNRLYTVREKNQERHEISDTTLIVKQDGKDDVEFKVHRCVLAKASPVFRGMFSCRMRETLTGRIELSGFDGPTIHLVVRHIYGENIENSMQLQALDVYRFGHQYNVSSLFELSQRVILGKMSNWTCIDILNLGFLCEDKKLMEKASAFILEHFSELAEDNGTHQKLWALPPTPFLALLESDRVIATELEIFLVGMKWFSCHKRSISVVEVVRRIRWPMMTMPMFRTAMNSPLIIQFPVLHKFLKSSRRTISQHLNGTIPQRRHIFGEPMAIVSLPAIRQPPAVLSFEPAVDGNCNRRPRSLHIRHSIQHRNLSSGTQEEFSYEGMAWVFRVELNQCKSSRCSNPCLSAMLWLDENDEKCVSWGQQHDGDRQYVFPIRVKARCMVWNDMGGQFHHRDIDFTFQSLGWGAGWCVQDLLGGHGETNAFFDRLSSNRDVGPVLQVAVEILKCENG